MILFSVSIIGEQSYGNHELREFEFHGEYSTGGLVLGLALG